MTEVRLSHDMIYTLSKFFLGGPELIGYYRFKSLDNVKEFYKEYFPFLEFEMPEGVEENRYSWFNEAIREIIKNNQFERLINIMLSPRYISKEFILYENIPIRIEEAVRRSEENLELLDGMLYSEGYCIRKDGDEYRVLTQEEELIRDEYVPFAQGSMALIYKHKEAPIVMKQLFPTLREVKDFVFRFRREYETTKALGDIYGVINVFDFDEEKYTYKMDALDCSLFDYFKKNEHVPVLTKIEFVTQMITVMAQVHRRNVIHRDLHPSNIFLRGNEIVIADFGLGKELTKIYTYDVGEKTIGNQTYAPPEQRNATYGFEAKTCDVYAMGKVINFIFTGNPENTHHMMSDVAKRATALDPKKRYRDAEHMKEEVEMRLRNLKTIGKYKPFFRKSSLVDNTDNKMWGGYSRFKKTIT